MGNFFGKSKKAEVSSRVTDQDKAVLELKKQRDNIRKYQERIQLALDKERELAKKLLQDGKKDRAKLLLKKKRFQESQLDKSEQLLDNLEKLVHDLEFAQVEVQVLDGLKTGNEALKKIHDVLSVDAIEQILEETREGVEKQAEIDALLSNNLSPEDLEAVETELEQLMGLTGLALPSPDEPILTLPDAPEDLLPEPRDEAAAVRRKEKVALAAS